MVPFERVRGKGIYTVVPIERVQGKGIYTVVPIERVQGKGDLHSGSHSQTFTT